MLPDDMVAGADGAAQGAASHFERGLSPRNRFWGEVRKGGEAPLQG
jgi:hypothetical protein